jgi:hypothetical protein
MPALKLILFRQESQLRHLRQQAESNLTLGNVLARTYASTEAGHVWQETQLQHRSQKTQRNLPLSPFHACVYANTEADLVGQRSQLQHLPERARSKLKANSQWKRPRRATTACNGPDHES